jgi:alpha-D-xyloside xylohydrolase
MRGLVMDFSDDANVLNINDQYMFGPAFLVCPVSEFNARSRKVYLPKCEGWYDFNSGKFYNGGQIFDANAPYDRMPVFVKAGSIIPMGKPMEYTDQYPDDELTINVFAGADGSFKLYSDEGTNYNYEKGEYSLIPMEYNDTEQTLTLCDRKGSYKGMPQNLKITVCHNKQGNSEDNLYTATYTGKKLVIQMK